jgi:hypothetical protein
VKFLERQKDFVVINGERYVRFSAGRVAAVLLLHESAIEELRTINDAIATAKAPSASWESIYESGTVMTCRMQVPGGWLLKHTNETGSPMVFVPDAKHVWKTKLHRTL